MAKVLQIVDDNTTPSIQGEQQDKAKVALMDLADVDTWMDSVPPEASDCREQRHRYPTIREVGMAFSGVAVSGNLTRRLTCKNCKMAVRVEEWDVRHKGDVVTRCDFVDSHLEYIKGANGETYTAPPGKGRITPKLIRTAQATGMLKDESFKKLKKSAVDAAKSRYAGAHTGLEGLPPAPKADAG
jgi:hypothetical protein